LVGNYVETGDTNHDRKVYRRVDTIPGFENINVLLYYWDTRDGEEYSGWWFGNSIGGSEVWSRCDSSAMWPPQSGWTIPWDGEIDEGVVVKVDKPAPQDEATEETTAAQDGPNPSMDEWMSRVDTAIQEINTMEPAVYNSLAEVVENLAEGTLAKVKGDKAGERDAVPKCRKILTAQATSLETLRLNLATAAKGSVHAPAKAKASLQKCTHRWTAMRAALREHIDFIKKGIVIEGEDGEGLDDNECARVLDDALPGASEKVDAADDEVDNVASAAAPLQLERVATSEEEPMPEQSAKATLADTERLAVSAQHAVAAAREDVARHLIKCAAFPNEARESAMVEFLAMQDRLKNLQARLNVFVGARASYNKRLEMRQQIQDLGMKVVSLEIDVEKVTMMTAAATSTSSEVLKNLENAVNSAQQLATQFHKALEAQRKAAPELFEAELSKLQERAEAAQDKLDGARKTTKELQVKHAAESMVQEVTDKVVKAEEMTDAAEAAESSPLEEVVEKLGAAREAAAESHSFITRKLVEVGRFPPQSSGSLKEDVEQLAKRLEESRDKLQKLRGRVMERKSNELLVQANDILKELQAMVAAAQPFTTAAVEALGETGEALLREAEVEEKVRSAVSRMDELQITFDSTRTKLEEKSTEIKKLASSASVGVELGRLELASSTSTDELVKLHALSKRTEERFLAKKGLHKFFERLKALEGDLDRLVAGSPTVSMEAADNRLGAIARFLEAKLPNATEAVKEELQAVGIRVKAAEKKMDAVKLTAKEKEQRDLCQDYAKECEAAVAQAESIVDGPIEEVEAKLQKARSLKAARAAEVQEFLPVVQEEAKKTFEDITKRLGVCTTAFVTRKQKASQESFELCDKITDDLAVRLAKYTDDSWKELPPAEAFAVTMGTGDLESSAEEELGKCQATLASLEPLLADGKAESNITSVISELKTTFTATKAKLQELADSWTEREHKFVASRLVQETDDVAEAMRKGVDLATEVVAPLLSEEAETQEELLLSSFADRLALGSIERSKQLRGNSAGALSQSESAEEIVKALESDDSEKAQDKLASWLQELSVKLGTLDCCVSIARSAEIAERLSDNGVVSTTSLSPLVGQRYVCIKSYPSSCSQTAAFTFPFSETSVEIGEGLILLEPLEQGAEKGLFALQRKQKALEPVQKGSNSLLIPLEYVARIESIACHSQLESLEAYALGLQARCREALAQLNFNIDTLAAASSGPLPEARQKLLQRHSSISAELLRADSLASRCKAARAALERKRKVEIEKVQVEQSLAIAAVSLQNATQLLVATEQEVGDAVSATQLPAEATDAQSSAASLTLAELQEKNGALESAWRTLGQSKEAVDSCKVTLEKLKVACTKEDLEEPLGKLAALSQRQSEVQRRLSAANAAFKSGSEKARKSLAHRARDELRAACRLSDKFSDPLSVFEELKAAGGDNLTESGEHLSKAGFTAFVKGVKEDVTLNDEQITLLFEEFGADGLSNMAFCKVLQEYSVCTQASDMTTEMDPSVEESKLVRRIEKGELLEVLDGPIADAGPGGLVRVLARAVKDSAIGWVTMKEGSSPATLKPREKPFLRCTAEGAPVLEAMDPNAAKIAELMQDETLELVEGPRPLKAFAQVQAQVTAAKDDSTGWVLISDEAGKALTVQTKELYVCRLSIGLTDVRDIKICKNIRKLDIGEKLEPLDFEESDETTNDVNMKRILVRALKDGVEGWVTTTGTQGSVFVSLGETHYKAEQELKLRSGEALSSAVKRVIEVGEELVSKDEPKQLKPKVRLAIKTRSLAEPKKVGWVIFGTEEATVRPFKENTAMARSV